jgi:hypothetical protein
MDFSSRRAELVECSEIVTEPAPPPKDGKSAPDLRIWRIPDTETGAPGAAVHPRLPAARRTPAFGWFGTADPEPRNGGENTMRSQHNSGGIRQRRQFICLARRANCATVHTGARRRSKASHASAQTRRALQVSPVYLSTVSSAGAVKAPVFCNGVSWVYE